MALLYNELENFTKADNYFKQAEQYWEKGTNYERYYFANSRGNYFYNTKEYPEALHWFRQAYRITNTFQQKIPGAIVEANLGEIFILTNQPDSAQYYLDLSKASWDNFYDEPSVKFYIDGLYASLALKKNKIPEAEKLLLQKYDLDLIVPQYIYFHNRRMQELYELKKDYKNAYLYKTKADAYNDSLRNVKVQQNIAETDFRYQQDTTILKKDLQIAEVEIKASKWKNTALISIFSFIFFLIIATSIIFYRKRLRELKYNKQLATINGLRMEIIRNRISPHFTSNVLNTMMPALEEYKELEQPFRLLIQMLRANLHASEKISVSLEDEISLVKNYILLYMTGHPGRIHVNWKISEDVPLDTLVPSMSIQIPVENAIKYAFPEIIHNPQININISRNDEEVHIIIQDNGTGFYPANIHNTGIGTGNGLRMLYQTTELLNNKNTHKMQFKILNLNREAPTMSGTQVFLIIPFNYRFDL